MVVRDSWTGPLEELPAGDTYHPLVRGWLSHEATGKLLVAGLNFDELAEAPAHHGFKAVPLNSQTATAGPSGIEILHFRRLTSKNQAFLRSSDYFDYDDTLLPF